MTSRILNKNKVLVTFSGPRNPSVMVSNVFQILGVFLSMQIPGAMSDAVDQE